jgi:hypothetical protein
MYRTTGYTLSTLNKNVTGLILDYLPYIDLIHLGLVNLMLNEKITSWCGFRARKSTALLTAIRSRIVDDLPNPDGRIMFISLMSRLTGLLNECDKMRYQHIDEDDMDDDVMINPKRYAFSILSLIKDTPFMFDTPEWSMLFRDLYREYSLNKLTEDCIESSDNNGYLT